MIAGRYEVAGHPLMGGMGIVYLCMDRHEDRPVALKTFRPEFLPDRSARDRFLREGATWVNLGRNPHIVRCYNIDHISDGREVYLVLELIAQEQGRRDASLRSWLIPGQSLLVEQALLFALQVVRGMKHACKQIPGFVHRDLKPENLLIGADQLSSLGTNRLRVTDFGLANILQVTGESLQVMPPVTAHPSSLSRPTFSRTQLTHGIVGTPLYMAPEQWLKGQMGVYTDVYALGCILLEMITGKQAVLGDNLRALEQAHCEGQVQALPASLPEAIGDLVGRCLQINPIERYVDWGELESALGAAWQQINGQELPAAETPQELDSEERVAVGWSYNNIGISYMDIGKINVACDYFKRVQAIGQAEDNRSLESAALNSLGNAYAILGDARLAIRFFEQQMEIAHEIGDQRGEMSSLIGLGGAYRDIGDIQRAIGFFQQALEISREIEDRYQEGIALEFLGLTYTTIDDTRQAIGFFEQYLEVCHETRHRKGAGDALGSLGIAYLQLGNIQRAIGFFQQALEISREIEDQYKEGSSLESLGLAYLYSGNPQRAIGFFDQSLAVCREIGDRLREMSVLGSLGTAYARLGDVWLVIGFSEQCLNIHREIGDVMEVAEFSFRIANLYAREGEPQKALPYAQEADRIWSQFGHIQNAQRVQGLVTELQGDTTPSRNAENSTQAAFEAFRRAGSAQKMQAAVTQNPLIIDAQFIAIIEQASLEQNPTFKQRLEWLHQIVKEQE